MNILQDVLESVRPVVAKAKDVFILDKGIGSFVDSITQKELERSEFNRSLLLDVDEEHIVGFCLAYNSLNFCFWGDPKWTVTYEDSHFDGSYGLARSLMRAYREGLAILDPKYLQHLSTADARGIFRGNTEIPLFYERVQILRDLGKITVQKFGGAWMNIVSQASFNAEHIVQLLVQDFPSIFRDEAQYDGHNVKFYKRAQIIPGYFAHDLKKLGIVSFEISGMDQITAYADYKIPQMLRKFGMLKYSPKLTSTIDAQIEIPAGSHQEVEIRAATIETVDRIAQHARKRFPSINAAKVDAILWFRGQKKSPDDKPYHRTRTIWY